MLDTVKINHVQHISFTQPRLTDAVSVILRELLSYEHPSKVVGFVLFYDAFATRRWCGALYFVSCEIYCTAARDMLLRAREK
jgi:hypothetical protein